MSVYSIFFFKKTAYISIKQADTLSIQAIPSAQSATLQQVSYYKPKQNLNIKSQFQYRFYPNKCGKNNSRWQKDEYF
jgi:hypothetical protein